MADGTPDGTGHVTRPGTPAGTPPITTLSSRIAYENPWLRVREDEIERADGSRGVYGVVEKADFAVIIPRDEDGLWLVEQYRYPIGERSWELPQGSWEAGDGGTPEALARAELAEETGLQAGRLRHLGRLHEASGYASQGMDVWLAEDLTMHRPRRSVSEQDMRAARVTTATWHGMIRSGAVTDAVSLAAYSLLLLADPATA